MDRQPLEPVRGARVWRGPALAARPHEWTHHLDDVELTELDAAVARTEASDQAITTIRAEHFPLPRLGATLTDIQSSLQDGRGFTLLRGVPVSRYTPRQAAIAFFGIGAHLGEAVSQNARGHALGHVYDLGFDPALPTARGYQSSRKLNFHTDPTDVVGLMCLRTAKRGGASRIVSSASVFNEMLARSPDLVEVLTRPIYRDRRGEIPEGRDPWYRLPVFNFRAGRLLVNYVRSTIDKAQRFEQVPRLTREQLDAFELIESIATDPELVLDMRFEPGDIQLLNNHFIMHSRSEYEDHAQPSQRRHLLRLWLACETGPPLPEAYYEFMGRTAAGRPNGYQLGGVPLSAPLTPEDGGPGDSEQRIAPPRSA